MIYTCTINPSLDYYLKFNSAIDPEHINRAIFEEYDAGGKGVNVSIVLNNLMIPNVALGFLGGFTKDFYLSLIKKYTFVEPLFTSIQDNTRINLKILADSAIDINAKGPHITDEEFDRFERRLSRIYPNDIFVLSGNVQSENLSRMLKIIADLKTNGVKIVLDTNIEVIKECISIKPFLVRMNPEDVLKVANTDNLHEAIRILTSQGIENLIVPINDFGSLYGNREELYSCNHHEDTNINTTGTSDSMVAGFIYAIQKGADCIEAFKFANAAGIATSISGDLASRETTENCYQKLSIERL